MLFHLFFFFDTLCLDLLIIGNNTADTNTPKNRLNLLNHIFISNECIKLTCNPSILATDQISLQESFENIGSEIIKITNGCCYETELAFGFCRIYGFEHTELEYPPSQMIILESLQHN